MSNNRIATTERSGLIVQRIGDNDVYKMLPHVQRIIELGNLGAEYALLFAEPVDCGRSIDWYSEKDDLAVCANDLAYEEKQQLFQRFQEMREKLQNYVATMRTPEKSQNVKNYADILEKALVIPNVHCLYSIKGNPVMVCWGFSQGDNSVVEGNQQIIREIQTELARKPVTNPIIANDQPQANSPTTGIQPNSTSTPALSTKKSSYFLPIVGGILLVLALACVAWYFLQHQNPAQTISVSSTSQSSSTPQAPEKQHSDNPQDTPQKPEETTPDTSLAFLKGEINVHDVLADEKQQKIDLRINFPSEDGKGTTSVIEKNQTCNGTVIASHGQNNTVVLSLSEITCPNKNNYPPYSIVCVRGEKSCLVQDTSGRSLHLEIDIEGEK